MYGALVGEASAIRRLQQVRYVVKALLWAVASACGQHQFEVNSIDAVPRVYRDRYTH